MKEWENELSTRHSVLDRYLLLPQLAKADAKSPDMLQASGGSLSKFAAGPPVAAGEPARLAAAQRRTRTVHLSSLGLGAT